MDKPELLSDLTYINTDLTDPVAPSGRRRRRYKIAWVLMGVLLLVGILPVYTVSSRLIELNKESLKTQQQVYQLQLATSLAHHMDSYVEGQQRTVTVLAEVLAGEMANHSGGRFMAELSRRRTLSKYVDDDLALIRYTHRDGSSVTAMREGFVPDETMESLLADEFVQQMNRGAGAEAVVGKPFYSAPLEGPVVILSTPVLQDGRRVGAISALAGIVAIWKEAKDSSGYSLFALNDEGELFTESGDGGAIAGVAYPELEIVREFISTGGSRVMPYVIRDGGGDAISLLGSYAQTRHGWGVFVQAEENKAYYLVEDMRWNTWFLTALAAIGAVIAGGLFAGWISRPIKRLADSSRAFADGDFHARVPVRSGHEVGVLAETFNVMAETLERYITRLKRAAQENSQLFVGSIRALAAAIDEKDAYTRGHSERVRQYAATLARAMGLPPQEVWKTEIGALLHDVGKIGIQDCILNKPGPLTDDEYEVMKSHPVKGANIMGPIQQLEDVIPVMKHHHERWDGGGYPDGLEAAEIPLSTRLVTIADCWDAMTTNRPYQKAMDLDTAVRRLQALSGRAFDPAVAEAFVACVQRGDLDEVMGDARRQIASTAADLDRIRIDEAATAVARDNTDPDCLPPAPEPLQD